MTFSILLQRLAADLTMALAKADKFELKATQTEERLKKVLEELEKQTILNRDREKKNDLFHEEVTTHSLN